MGDTRSVGRGAPGRARTPRPEREAQMIDVASAMFAQRGFGGCSMDDIAEASGISKPMLYAYFDSKEGLFAACAERAGAKLREGLRAMSEDEGLSPDRQLWQGLLQVFAFVDEHNDSWLLLYPEGGQAAGALGSGAAAARDAMAELLTELFLETGRAQGMTDEQLSHMEPIAQTVTAATIAAASHWAKRRSEPREMAALRLMNLLWTGMGGMMRGELWLPE